MDDVVEVSEEEIARAIFFCVQNNRLVVEGAARPSLLYWPKIKVTRGRNGAGAVLGYNIDAISSPASRTVLVRQDAIMFKLLVLDRPGMLATLLNKVAESGPTSSRFFTAERCGSPRWVAPGGASRGPRQRTRPRRPKAFRRLVIVEREGRRLK